MIVKARTYLHEHSADSVGSGGSPSNLKLKEQRFHRSQAPSIIESNPDFPAQTQDSARSSESMSAQVRT
jgi:hypothetical protein